MQKVSKQSQVSSSCFRCHKALIYFSTRVKHDADKSILNAPTCLFSQCSTRHERQTISRQSLVDFSSRTGHDRVHSVIYLRETCPPSHFTNFFFCVIRCGFFRGRSIAEQREMGFAICIKFSFHSLHVSASG